jgi:hypothetical protein
MTIAGLAIGKWDDTADPRVVPKQTLALFSV